ncbi:hypothetical protein CHLNCDRAFT_134300 [Chlorella variabilis]|uniref:6-phosphofructo-2-kinase domain-containing protein n=1 Tax=Chlorella variabilis TaxID=554065 RepID=E1ZFQ3_CHLVA|nr:hypothetical protein CHLNCDRAFT_134300 [Chlorella variabilis]EFN55319.1 hypothetical protein CHLNCDRAFT_134300 [Chlorella variabilis]|eukprot:XP_005847421.1 hypothetical protein CHLNCDRAFT_134300 [Chlorella variabilis]
MMYSPDYRGVDTEQALSDFRARIRKYEDGYETIMDRTVHYIKLIDMIWLTRHGESQFNTQGKIGGNSPLSQRGQMYAQLLPEILNSRIPRAADGKQYPVAVWTSTLQRTIITASGLPYPKVQWKALDEIQAGMCDGMTYEEVAQDMPHEFGLRRKDKLRYRYPSGESYMDVIQRLEPVVTEVEREKECVVIVSHQAVLRALYGYFMNQPLEERGLLEKGGKPQDPSSMAELAAAELVRQEEVGLETRESLDGPALAGVAAGMRQGSRRDSFSGGRSV